MVLISLGSLVGLGSVYFVRSPVLLPQPLKVFPQPAQPILAAVPTQPTLSIPISVTKAAQQVTVRVMSSVSTGSGVLIGRRGKAYQVLTCEHVVATRAPNSYTILTTDGKTHTARRLSVANLRSLDLAIVEFESDQSYTLVQLGTVDRLQAGTPIYAVGFPNYRFYPNENRIESTKDWGLRAYRLTTGRFLMLLDRPLAGGYRLGYSNEVEQGMSGGAVLDSNGLLIGINGRLKYPIQGIDSYKFIDGSRPSTNLSQHLEELSWAIPVSSFQQTITQFQQRAFSQN